MIGGPRKRENVNLQNEPNSAAQLRGKILRMWMGEKDLGLMTGAHQSSDGGKTKPKRTQNEANFGACGRETNPFRGTSRGENPGPS